MLEEAIRLMTEFAERTGVTSGREPRRYLWTDAFAVCNYLGLARATGRDQYTAIAIRLIDQVHRLMHLWKSGDVVKVDEYLDDRGLRHNRLFHQLMQAIIELADRGSEERSLLESISNHLTARGMRADHAQLLIETEDNGQSESGD